MNLEAVVWSEFAAAVLTKTRYDSRWDEDINATQQAQYAARAADVMMVEFRKRFPGNK